MSVWNETRDAHAWLAALYGQPYMQAAQSAWHLLRDRGVDALVNDSLVGMSECPSFISTCHAHLLNPILQALTWGAYAVGMLCSLFAYLYLRCESSVPHVYGAVQGADPTQCRHTPVVQHRWAVHRACAPLFIPHWPAMQYVPGPCVLPLTHHG